MLRFLPHLPFPFLAPSHSLPLCIFKPVKLPQLHPPHPLHRGRGPRPPLVWAPVGCLLGLGCVGGRGQTTSPWDLEGLGDKPQAQGMEPAGGGRGAERPAKGCQGVWPAAGRVLGVRPAHRAVCSNSRCLGEGLAAVKSVVVRPVALGPPKSTFQYWLSTLSSWLAACPV